MRTSVSQVETFERCPSWWAYGHVHGVWKARNATAEAGTDVHAYLEAYSAYGQKPDKTPHGVLAAAVIAMDLVPSPADEPSVEEKGELAYAGHTFVLSADALWLSPAGVMVNDYKSVKTFGFAKNVAKLRSDLQAAVYALYALRQHPAAAEVNLRWVYMRRNDGTRPVAEADIRVVETTMDEDDARAILRSRRQTLDNMEAIKAKQLPMLDVTRNLKSCTAMSGCPYRGECFPGKYTKDTGKPIEP